MNTPKDPKEAPVLDHNYDGIQEYDNPLPNWWLTTFFATIIFAFVYYIHYEVAGGPTLLDELKISMQDIEKKANSVAGNTSTSNDSEESYAAFFKIEANKLLGKEIYASRCASCHAPEGQGLIGPNLTDNFWIHGKGSHMDIALVVKNGVLDKGMPNWESMLKPNELKAVIGYAHALVGTHPANPKAPQGNEVK